MREIKFRSWDEGHKTMYSDPSGYSGDYSASWSDIVSDNPILMQYTGLKDKNGKEIYEGDIVKCLVENLPDKYDDVLPVVYSNDKTGFLYGDGGSLVGYYDSEDLEVVGNIYENPELV